MVKKVLEEPRSKSRQSLRTGMAESPEADRSSPRSPLSAPSIPSQVARLTNLARKRPQRRTVREVVSDVVSNVGIFKNVHLPFTRMFLGVIKQHVCYVHVCLVRD